MAGSRAQPFIIDDDDEDVPQHPLSSCIRQVNDIWQQIRQATVVSDSKKSPDDEAQREIKKAETRYEQEQELDIIDLTQDDHPEPLIAQRRSRTARRVPLTTSHKSVTACNIDGRKYHVGDCVEIKEALGDWTIEFIEIASIWVSPTGGVICCGQPYTRARHLGGRLNCTLNEVCQILELDADNDRGDHSDIEIHGEQILRHRTLHKTNARLPEFRFGGNGFWVAKSKLNKKECAERAPLTCRWKMRLLYKDNKPWRYATSLVHFTEGDVQDSEYRVLDRELRKEWLGVDRTGPSSADGQSYTFCDVFSGCGGVTRGAVMAGLKPLMSVDHWEDAHRSFVRNFSNVRAYNEDVSDFIKRKMPQSCCRVDVLHLSPPCQFFAPCHTREGRNDEQNSSALFACLHLVDKLRPRFVTLEQTFGLAERHQGYLNGLANNFTTLGYSIQWRVVPMVEYGLPQTRKRLIVIAACPGEELPSWPAPTHGPRGSGLKPFVTEAAAFRPIRANTDRHDVRNARRLQKPRRDPNKPFPSTITCGGPTSGNWFYDGTRAFTHREVACLQGFPLNHVFEGRHSSVIKQIGNAFAPCVVKAFLEHLRKCLERRDAVHQEPLPLPATPRSRRSLSAASSVTLGFSPSPRLSSGSSFSTSSGADSGSGSGSGSGRSFSSGSSLGKRKFKDVDDRPAKLQSLTKGMQRITVTPVDDEQDVILLDKSPNVGASSSRTSSASTVSGRRDWTPFPRQRDNQSISFPRGLWKLPATRGSSSEWKF